MKIDAMKKKSAKDLDKHAAELRVKILDAKKKHALAESTDATEVRKLRRELAQTLTFMTQKNAEEQNG